VDEDVHPLGESFFSSNPFCVRVVRVFRGSISFFQDLRRHFDIIGGKILVMRNV